MEHIGSMSTLKDIDFSLCSLLTDEGIFKFCVNEPNTLTKINLSGLFRLTNAGLNKIISHHALSLTHIIISLLAQVITTLFYS